MTERPPRYVGVISPVREVTLVANGDLAYWQSRLPPCGVQVFNDQGCAELLISSLSSRWMIFSFCELTICLQVSLCADGSTRDGLYLLEAYNSSRLLTWCERTFFRTPYRLAEIEVKIDPAETKLQSDNLTEKLRMVRAPRSEGVETVEECWEGPIYLPPAHEKQPKFERFFARLEGQTEICPFDPARDTFECSADFARQIVPREWHIRRAGKHSRSKTYAVS